MYFCGKGVNCYVVILHVWYMLEFSFCMSRKEVNRRKRKNHAEGGGTVTKG